MRWTRVFWWLLGMVIFAVGCGGDPGDMREPEPTAQSSAAAVSGGTTGFALSALPATIQAGATGDFTVRAVDASSNTATGYVGTVRFYANYPSTTFSASYTFTPADLGVHTFQFRPFEAGVQILYATDTSDASVYGEASVTCVPANATQYWISNLTSGAALNAGAPAAFDITAVDPYWNVATGYAGTAVVTSSDGAAILPPNPKFTAGVATNVPITFMTAGAQTVTATDSQQGSMTDTVWATVNAAPAAAITAPANATEGTGGLAASVAPQSAATYAWSISNGAITGGAGTSSILFSVGSVGTATLSCVVTRAAGSSTGTATVHVVAAPVTPTITGATTVNSASTGNTASVAAHAGMTYRWTIVNGGITSAGGAVGVTSGSTNTITYTAGAVGTITITAAEVNAALTTSPAATLLVSSVSAPPAPSTPVITAPTNATVGLAFTASAPAAQGLTYAWTVGGVPVASAVSNGATSITYTPAAVGNLGVVCTASNGSTSASASKTVAVVAAPVTPTITASSPVTTGQTNRSATVVAHAGMHYLWTITGGTITSAGGTAGTTSSGVNRIRYTAGPVGTIALTAVELNAANTASAAAGATVIVVAGSVATPTISAASPVTTGAAGLTASVTARSGMTYQWTINGGTITSAGGASGVTSGSTNTLTYTAGAVGTLALTCRESNGAATSAAASRNVTVIAAPATPVISVASSATSNTAGLTATVAAHAGMTYAWSITNGTLTSAAAGVTSNGVNTATFTSGSPGTLTLAVTETNAASVASAPGTASVAVTQSVTPPVTPSITLTDAAVTSGTSSTARVTARAGMTYVWTIAGGTITSAGGPSGVTSGSTNTLTFTAGAAGTLALTCAESNGNVTSAPASAAVTVVAAPQAPSISAPASVSAAQTNVSASVTARAGMTYSWSITGGTITSAGGASGVTTGSTNGILFTAGSSGVVSLSCFELNSLGAASAPGSASVTINGSGPPPSGHIYVATHQDDDLLFMNPDIERSIRSGHPTRVVFTMAAGSPDLATWQAREHGVYTPYMVMANASFDIYADSATYWTCGNHTYAGFPVRLCTLTQNPKVSVVFLRLPDGALSSLWAADSGAPFYVTPHATLTTADGANTYTRASLIATLGAILDDFAPARIGTMDGTFAYGDDHQDHVASGLFALEASHLLGSAGVETRVYRGYSIDGADYYSIPAAEAEDLAPAEYTEKLAVMTAYGGGFPVGSSFDRWCHRRYAISSIRGGLGPIAESTGSCLDVQGGATADGTAVIATTCNASAAQAWTVTPDARLVGPGGKCLTAGSAGAAQISTCSASPAQKWTLFANGQLRGQNATCLTDVGGGTLRAALCDADRSSSRYQPAAAQRFVQRASSPFAWSSGANFSDLDVGALASSYRSLGLLDLDGDGYSDACIRLATGVHCATNGHNLLGTYTLFSAAFTDANGWSGDGYGSTVQYADVNGDHRPDVCARASNGIVCATGTSTGFAPPTTWTTEFSDSTVFAGAAYYRSIHFADVNGDGYADVCGRNAGGVVCALNTTSGAFAAATPWITTEFTDAAGWSSDAYASTVQLADVDGDGRADVCGRGPLGLRCATSNGASGFVDAHLWSFRADFADASAWNTAAGYYGSIHFGDLDGDGLADVCGRSSSGLVCARSDATAFQQAMAVQPSAFTDALGWKPDAYGVSLRVADVNHDGHADVCGRSSSGLVCTTMP